MGQRRRSLWLDDAGRLIRITNLKTAEKSAVFFAIKEKISDSSRKSAEDAELFRKGALQSLLLPEVGNSLRNMKKEKRKV